MATPNASIDVRVTPPVGTIVLNRPAKRNALSQTLIAELSQAIGDMRAVVLTGAGDAFCAGRDLQEMASDANNHETGNADGSQNWADQEAACCDLIGDLLTLPKPTIAAVNGPAVGLGVGLALASDFIIASRDASLGLPETRYGLVAGVVAPLLAYRIGAGPASRLLMAGQLHDAQEIYRMGLYHELVANDLLWARAVEIGTQCAAGAPQAISLTKRLLLDTVGEKLLTDLACGAIASATARTTDAATEGLRAFVDRRDPEWE